MKHLLASLTLILTLSLISAQGIKFFEGTFEEAQAEAKAQGKLIFMDAYAVWCGPCKMMTNSVFPLENVGDFFNANFINIKVDMEKGEGLTLRRKYGISAYPTLLLLNAEGEVVELSRGGRGADALIAWAKQAVIPNQVLVDKLQEKYDAGDRSKELLQALIKVKATYNQDFNNLFEEYLKDLSPEEVVKESNANFIFEQTKSINSPGIKILKGYQTYFKTIVSEEAFKQKIINLSQTVISEAYATKEIHKINEASLFLKDFKVENYKELNSEVHLNFYKEIEDWINYDKAASKHLAKYKKDNDEAYREVAWNYYMKIDDDKALKKAEKWMQAAVKKNNSYDNNLTQAYLLYKLKNYSAAEDAVNYAIYLTDDSRRIDNAQILKNRILMKMGKTGIVE